MNQSETFNDMATQSPTLAQLRLDFRCADLSEGAVLTRSPATAILIASAILALALGVMVYLSDRPPSHAALIPAMLALGTGSLFGALGNWLPSFVHPFAFSLISSTLRATAAAPAYGTCAAWWSVNIVFEVGQHPVLRPFVVERMQATLGDGWLTRPVSNYLQRGTFDVGDLIAATLGALTAALLLFVIHRWEVSRAHE